MTYKNYKKDLGRKLQVEIDELDNQLIDIECLLVARRANRHEKKERLDKVDTLLMKAFNQAQKAERLAIAV